MSNRLKNLYKYLMENRIHEHRGWHDAYKEVREPPAPFKSGVGVERCKRNQVAHAPGDAVVLAEGGSLLLQQTNQGSMQTIKKRIFFMIPSLPGPFG